jgi:hypothetical protein
MTHPEHDALPRDRHLDRALDHAHRLTEPRPQPGVTPAWSGQAAHVGDLTVLALALSQRG